MKILNIFVSVDASDFSGLSDWWSQLLDRRWDREPMPSCHEWDLTPDVLFQVLDNPGNAGKATVTLRVSELDAHIERLRQAGIDVPDAAKVEGFDALRYVQFEDPEGNKVGLLEGA